MDDLLEKIEELRKGLLSLKQPMKQDFFVPAIKAPTIPKPSFKGTNKIPGGLPPPSKKDPAKVAEQLKNPRPGKAPQTEVLKVEKNGQWTLTKGLESPGTKVSGTPTPARAARTAAARAPVNSSEGFAGHSPAQSSMIHGLDFQNAKPMRGSVAGGAQLATNPTSGHNVILKRAADHANQQERGHLDNGFNSAKREVLYHNMARDYFGMGKHVPTTAGFSRGGEDYSAQAKIPNAQHVDLKENEGDWEAGTAPKEEFANPNHAAALSKLHESGDLHKLALMDHLMGHHDRHSGNYMMDDKNNLHLIDNGTAFDYKNFDTNEYPGYLNRAELAGKSNDVVHPEAVKWLNNLDADKAKEVLAANGHGPDSPATQGFLKRLDAMRSSLRNGPEHYKNMRNLLDKNRLSTGPLYQHPENNDKW